MVSCNACDWSSADTTAAQHSTMQAGASRRPPAAQQRQHHTCTVTMLEYKSRQYNTCSGWNPVPALASAPIVRSWGVRDCTQLQVTVTYATAALCDVHNV
jgi:hypothetical protein